MSQHIHSKMKKWVLWVPAATIVAIVLFVAGCGNHASSIDPATTALLSTGFKQVGATYVGSLTCRNCHANIYSDYANQKDITPWADTLQSKLPGMGSTLNNPPISNPTEPMMSPGSNQCDACHVTGLGDPTGFKDLTSTPQMDGIGCEDCHGPGSKHVAASTTTDRLANITRTPTASKTCWGCHADRLLTASGNYAPGGALQQPLAPVNDASLATQGPKVATPHHAAAAFMLGLDAYSSTSADVPYMMATPMPSPHTQLPNTCLDCHKPGVNAITDPVNPGKVSHGANAFKPNLDRTRPECVSCHGGRDTNFTTVQQGVLAKLIQLGGPSATDPAQPSSTPSATSLLGLYAAKYSAVIDLTGNTNKFPNDQHVIAYKAARYNYGYVRSEGSFGVHNPQFADALLADAIAKLANNP